MNVGLPTDSPKAGSGQQKQKKGKKVTCTEVDSSGTAVKDKSNAPTPRMEIQMGIKGGRVSCKALPDTGCTQTIMSLRWAKSHNIDVDPEGSVPILAADGKRMMCEGSAKLHIFYEGAEIKTEALVSSVLKDELLIS